MKTSRSNYHCQIYRRLILVAWALLATFLHSSAQSKDIHISASYWDNRDNTLREKFEYYHDFWSERDVRHGRLSRWDRRDRIMMDCYYKEDMMDSLCRVYFKSGEIRESSWWKEGKKNGAEKRFDKKGRMWSECGYAANKKQGIEYMYHPNGELRSLIQYENGVKHGAGSYYNREGALVQSCQFIYGKKCNRSRPEKPGKNPGEGSPDTIKEQPDEKKQDDESVPKEKKEKKNKKNDSKPLPAADKSKGPLTNQ